MNGASDLGAASDITGRVSLRRKPAISSVGAGGRSAFSKPMSRMFPMKRAQLAQQGDIPAPESAQSALPIDVSNPMHIAAMGNLSNMVNSAQEMSISSQKKINPQLSGGFGQPQSIGVEPNKVWKFENGKYVEYDQVFGQSVGMQPGGVNQTPTGRIAGSIQEIGTITGSKKMLSGRFLFSVNQNNPIFSREVTSPVMDVSMNGNVKSQQISNRSQMNNVFYNASGIQPFRIYNQT